MIYLRLHRARNEEIDQEQVGAKGQKFRYSSEISLQ